MHTQNDIPYKTYLAEDELPAAKKVLSAAALTYLASLLTSFVYFLRFLLYVLLIRPKKRARIW